MNVIVAILMTGFLVVLLAFVAIPLAFAANKFASFDENDFENRYRHKNKWMTKSEIKHAKWAEELLNKEKENKQ